MKEVIRKSYYGVLIILPKKIVINIENLFAYKKIISKKDPEFFGEKIQWLKLYGHLEQYGRFVDKYAVREYIEKKIGKKYQKIIFFLKNNYLLS